MRSLKKKCRVLKECEINPTMKRQQFRTKIFSVHRITTKVSKRLTTLVMKAKFPKRRTTLVMKAKVPKRRTTLTRRPIPGEH